jgi:hypothetical protein
VSFDGAVWNHFYQPAVSSALEDKGKSWYGGPKLVINAFLLHYFHISSGAAPAFHQRKLKRRKAAAATSFCLLN